MANYKTQYTGAPIHPVSAVLVIVLDYIWTLVEGGAVFSVVGLVSVPFLMLILFGISFVGVFLVQKFTASDAAGSAIAKAFVMGVIAAVPFPVTGTVAGGTLLVWAGVSAVNKLLRA